MKHLQLKWLIAIALAAQLSFLFWKIIDFRVLEVKGDTYYFHVKFMRVFDPFSIQFYKKPTWDLDELPNPDFKRKWRRYDTVFLRLDVDESNFIYPTSLDIDRPKAGVYLQAEVNELTSKGDIRLRPLLDRFYVSNTNKESVKMMQDIIKQEYQRYRNECCGRSKKSDDDVKEGEDKEEAAASDSPVDAQSDHSTRIQGEGQVVTEIETPESERFRTRAPPVDEFESKIWGEVTIHNGKAVLPRLILEGRPIVEIVQERLDREED